MSDKETTDLDSRVPHDTWQWCAIHELPMVHYDPGGDPFCWGGYTWEDVESCMKEESITVRLVGGFPRHIAYSWIDEKVDMQAAYDEISKTLTSQEMKALGYSGIATIIYAAFGLLDD